MTYDNYIGYLSAQATIVADTPIVKDAINSANQLVTKAQSVDSIIELFPSLDWELSEATRKCGNNNINVESIKKVLNSFSQQELIVLRQKLENLSKVNTNDSQWQLPSFIQDTYQTVTTTNIQEKLSLIRDREKAMSLYSGDLAAKIKEMDEAIARHTSPELKAIIEVHQKKVDQIKEGCKVSLTESKLQEKLTQINDLINSIRVHESELAPKIILLNITLTRTAISGLVTVPQARKKEAETILMDCQHPLNESQMNSVVSRINTLIAATDKEFGEKKEKTSSNVVIALIGLVVLIIILANLQAFANLLKGIVQLIATIIAIVALFWFFGNSRNK